MSIEIKQRRPDEPTLEIVQIGGKKMLLEYDPRHLTYEVWPLLYGAKIASYCEATSKSQQDMFLMGYEMGIRMMQKEFGDFLLRKG